MSSVLASIVLNRRMGRKPGRLKIFTRNTAKFIQYSILSVPVQYSCSGYIHNAMINVKNKLPIFIFVYSGGV